GKTTLAMALMGLLPATASVEGSVRFQGVELTGLSPEELRRLRGDRISMIFQDPMTSLDPTVPIGEQVAETITAHRHVDRVRARRDDPVAGARSAARPARAPADDDRPDHARPRGDRADLRPGRCDVRRTARRGRAGLRDLPLATSPLHPGPPRGAPDAAASARI